MYNFIPLNSFDLLFDLLFKFNINNSDIINISIALFLCGGISTLILVYYANRLGDKIIKNAGKIGTGVVAAVTGIDSALNIGDRFKGSGKTGNTGDSNKDSNKDNKDNKNGKK
jgi:hypothetical protein